MYIYFSEIIKKKSSDILWFYSSMIKSSQYFLSDLFKYSDSLAKNAVVANGMWNGLLDTSTHLCLRLII